MRRIRTADPKPSKQVRLVRAGVHVATVEDFADFSAATQQIFPRGLNVSDGEVQAAGRARCCRSHVLAEDHGARRTGRRELDPTPVITSSEITIETPSKSGVELFRAFGIRNGDDDHLKLHVDSRGIRVCGWFYVADYSRGCHF